MVLDLVSHSCWLSVHIDRSLREDAVALMFGRCDVGEMGRVNLYASLALLNMLLISFLWP